ncbi:MAG: GNAT family N-acetyltransferase [Oscillospiraceae bacterium]|nr:GNAT family N-acetyltransferase [Oscillospiraceae bacterium]
MTADDYDAVYALWRDTPNMGLNNMDDTREGIVRYLLRNPRTCFVAEKDAGNSVVGVILSGNDGRRGYIHHAAVRQSERRQGIGTALVEAALAALEREGICKVALVAFRKNEDGNAFWEKRGFGEREDLVYRDREIVELRKMYT